MARKQAPSFSGLHPSSESASKAARASSHKADTKCEMLLRRELWHRGVRYRLHQKQLPGNPDIVFPRQWVVVFCDGDFWHGRDLSRRIEKLRRGHNSAYWIEKIRNNVARDKLRNKELKDAGWTVLRFWEKEILSDVCAVADSICQAIGKPFSIGG